MSQTVTVPGGQSDAPDLAARITETGRVALDEARRIKVFEFVAGFALFAGSAVSLGFQTAALILAVLILISLGRRPKFEFGSYQLLVPLVAIALGYLAVVSYTAVPSEIAFDWKGRLIRMAVTMGAMFVAASGRIHLKSLLYGFAAALLANIPLFYLGLVPNTYGGALTGWAGDKNYAGLVYCIVGLMLLAYARHWTTQLAVFLVFAAALWLTGSRTSMAAFAAAIIWVVAAKNIGFLGRMILGAAIYAGVMVTAEDYSQIGTFSNRVGSDLLRARIDQAAQIKTSDSGFFGRGLGEAVVEVQNSTWFYHNSYWSALTEGGWPWLVVLLLLLAAVSLRPFSPKLNREQLISQALGIATLICAWRLGEVFVTLPWMMVMAYGLRSWIAPRNAAVIDGGRGSALDIPSDATRGSAFSEDSDSTRGKAKTTAADSSRGKGMTIEGDTWRGSAHIRRNAKPRDTSNDSTEK